LTSSTIANDQRTPAGAPQAEGVKPVDVSEFRFSPRQSGNADVTVTTGSGTSTTTGPVVELDVDTLYWGSVRLGLGTLVDVGNNWKSYSITTIAGSRQPEITETRDPVAFEIVSGFAPYLLDLLCSGHGRSYTGGCNAYFAPYLGFGVLGGSTNQGVQGLTSAHLGVELEFSKTFSIAATAVLRRTRGLNSGYEPGSPVTSGMSVADVTSNAWSSGFAIVVNATPAFLQFATGSGTDTTGQSQSTTTNAATTPVKK
jgi:hypothetical protein